MIGLCSKHPEPDLWFPEEQETRGRPTREAHRRMVERATLAMAICQDCPIKRQCADEGFKEENIEHGIWGGLLAGDRIILAHSRTSGTIRQQAIAFAEGVRAWQTIG